MLSEAGRHKEAGEALRLAGLAKLGSDVLGDHPLPGEVLRAAKLAG